MVNVGISAHRTLGSSSVAGGNEFAGAFSDDVSQRPETVTSVFFCTKTASIQPREGPETALGICTRSGLAAWNAQEDAWDGRVTESLLKAGAAVLWFQALARGFLARKRLRLVRAVTQVQRRYRSHAWGPSCWLAARERISWGRVGRSARNGVLSSAASVHAAGAVIDLLTRRSNRLLSVTQVLGGRRRRAAGRRTWTARNLAVLHYVTIRLCAAKRNQ